MHTVDAMLISFITGQWPQVKRQTTSKI